MERVKSPVVASPVSPVPTLTVFTDVMHSHWSPVSTQFRTWSSVQPRYSVRSPPTISRPLSPVVVVESASAPVVSRSTA